MRSFFGIDKGYAHSGKLISYPVRLGKILFLLCGGTESNLPGYPRVALLLRLFLHGKRLCEVKRKNPVEILYQRILCRVADIRFKNVVNRGYRKRSVDIVPDSLCKSGFIFFSRRSVNIAVLVKRRGSCPQLAVSGRGIVKRVVREHQRLSVMRKQAEEAVLKRVIALFLKQAQRQELALRLRHFSVRGVEVQDMEPEIAPPVPDISLGLCNLVRVVREGIVHPAAVNVKIFAAVFEGNGRALDMPAGISHSPRAVPFQLLIVELRFREPERKIGGIALVRVLSDALSHTDLKVVGIVLAENIVLFQL